MCVVIDRQTVSLYHKLSVRLDTRDASSGDRNLANIISVGHHTPQLTSSRHKQRNFKVYIHIRLLASGVLNSRKELCIYAHVAAGNSPLECSTLREEYIYIYRERERKKD